MKKIILTLITSIICLGAASILFSFDKKNGENSKINLNKNFQLSQLPSSQNTFITASLTSNFVPIRNWSVEEPDIHARAAGIFDPNGEKFLYQKNINEKIPIASLTKIMTAIVALENLNLDEIITISKQAAMIGGENGRLSIGEKLSVRDLLHIMLIESSNDAAIALANETYNFVYLMNKKAEEIGLKETNFGDPSGINPSNYSTITDLAKLAKYSFTQKSLLWQILGTKEMEIYSQDEKIKHRLVNTNKLLGEIPQMIGGKTGLTDEAGGCMLTMNKIQNNTGEYFIAIVLGSNDREMEIKKLIEWTEQAYVW